ncbi:MAG: tetratricopeptide repeat protein [Calditrichia bacterium]
MKKHHFLFAALAIFMVLRMGCAAVQSNRGQAMLKKGQTEEAIKYFLGQLKEDRLNPATWRDLGIAYFKNGEYEKAVKSLEESYKLNDKEDKTIFYLGASHEELHDYDRAIQYYRLYSSVSRLSKMRGQMEARLEMLTRKKMESEVALAIANESNLDVNDAQPNSIAVLYFQNLGRATRLDPLQKGLADMMITDLSQVKQLSVVERVKLQKLLDEMGLGMSGLVDETTAPRMGKLLGAGKLVKGTYIDLDEKNIRIDAGMVETRSGALQTANETSGELERLFRLEKNLVFNVIDEMGIALSDEEREAILYIPTESLLAFLAYSRGLDAEDRGNFREARSYYQEALKIDPGFKQARENAQKTEYFENGLADIRLVENEFTQTYETPLVEMNTRDRLQTSMSNIDAGFVPGLEAREPVPEVSKTTAFGGGIPVEIEISLPR